jgi:DNA-directed RNA polymerase specialized sigma24 family protein
LGSPDLCTTAPPPGESAFDPGRFQQLAIRRLGPEPDQAAHLLAVPERHDRRHGEDVRHFDNLAASQISRELIDLARSYHGPEGLGTNHHTDGADPDERLARVADGGGMPETLEGWAAFHETVDRLPEEERQVTELLWYRGLWHSHAAEALGVATKTVQRRWASARLMIRDALDGELFQDS